MEEKRPKLTGCVAAMGKKNWDMLAENWKKNCYTQIGEYQDAPAMRTRCSPRGAITLPYILTYLHTYILTYILTYLPTYSHTYILTYILTYLHSYILTYLPTYYNFILHDFILQLHTI